MGKYIRLALGVAAGAAAGIFVYAFLKKKREEKSLVMPEVKAGNIVRLPSARPPFAEAAQAAEDRP